MEKTFSKTGDCKNCKVQTSFILHRQFFANGSVNFVWVCSRCNQRNPDRSKDFFIPAGKVRQHMDEKAIEELPVIMPDCSNRCVRCGNRTAELHHWAPKFKFGKDEAELWPKDYLCRSCHDQWHKTMTPEAGL